MNIFPNPLLCAKFEKKQELMKKMFIALSLSIIVCMAYAQTFTLKSNDMEGQAQMKQVFNSFGCKGQNLSPQLSWVNVPIRD